MILLNKFISIFEENPPVKTFNMFLKNIERLYGKINTKYSYLQWLGLSL